MSGDIVFVSRVARAVISLVTIAALVLGLFVFGPMSANAQINPQIPFEGSLRDSAGNPVADGTYDMVFRLYDAPTGGATIWTGTYTTGNSIPVEVNDGVFQVMLGLGTGNALASSAFTDDTLYLGVAVEGDPEMTPRYRLGAAAYAFNADMLDGYEASDFALANGDTTFASSTTFSGDANFSSSTNFAGDTTFGDTTTFNDNSTFNSGATFDQGLTIASNTPPATANTIYNLGGTLYWNGAAVGAGGGASTLNDLTDVNAAQTAGSLLYWNGTAWDDIATSSLNIAETLTSISTTTGSFTFTDENGDDTTVNFNAAETLTQLLDNAAASGTFAYVDEAGATTTIDITTLPDLNITGDTTIGGELTVTGTSTAGMLVVSGDSTLGGGLSVAGNSTLATTTASQITATDSVVIADTASAPATTTDALYNNAGALYWNGSVLGANVAATKIDSSVASTTETLAASTNAGQVRFFTNIDLTNTATLAVQSGETLNGVTDGTFLFSNYAAGTQFRADEVSGGWVVSVVGASTQSDLHLFSLTSSDVGQGVPYESGSINLQQSNSYNNIIDPNGLSSDSPVATELVIKQSGLYSVNYLLGYQQTTQEIRVHKNNTIVLEGSVGNSSRGQGIYGVLDLVEGDILRFSSAVTSNVVSPVFITVQQLPTTESVLAGMVTPESLHYAVYSDGPAQTAVATVVTSIGAGYDVYDLDAAGFAGAGYDPQNLLNTATNAFEIKQAGLYELEVLGTANTPNELVIYVDGSEVARNTAATNGNSELVAAKRVINLTVGQNVEFGFTSTGPTEGFLSSVSVKQLPQSTVVGIDADDFTGTAGSVVFSDGTSVVEDNANFFYDDTNNSLGIRTATTSGESGVVIGGTSATEGGQLTLLSGSDFDSSHALDSFEGNMRILAGSGDGVSDRNVVTIASSTDTVFIGSDLPTDFDQSNIADNSLVVSNGAFCVDDGGLNCDDAARLAGSIYANIALVTGVDLAENYPSLDDTLQPGELVVIDADQPSHIARSGETAEQETLLGIISTKPGFLLGGYGDKEFEGAHRAAVALAGRVPVLFSAENGPVVSGDKLIASDSKPGYAMAACGPLFCGEARAVAVALESFSETMSGDTDLVQAELVEEVEEITEAIEVIEQNTDKLEATAEAVSEEIQEAVAEGDLVEMSELSAVAEEVSEELNEAIAIEDEAHELEATVETMTEAITTTTGEGRLMAFVEISNVSGEVEASAGFLSFIGDAAGAVGGFVKNQVVAVTGFFDTLFAREVRTETLCIGDTCVDEAGLEALLEDNDVEPVTVEEVEEEEEVTEPEAEAEVTEEVAETPVPEDESESEEAVEVLVAEDEAVEVIAEEVVNEEAVPVEETEVVEVIKEEVAEETPVLAPAEEVAETPSETEVVTETEEVVE